MCRFVFMIVSYYHAIIPLLIQSYTIHGLYHPWYANWSIGLNFTVCKSICKNDELICGLCLFNAATGTLKFIVAGPFSPTLIQPYAACLGADGGCLAL